jgi:hypothetical protein
VFLRNEVWRILAFNEAVDKSKSFASVIVVVPGTQKEEPLDGMMSVGPEPRCEPY